MNRCTGHCCKVFFLPQTPDELEEGLANATDGAIILDLAIPLVGKAATKAIAEYEKATDSKLEQESIERMYTCRHIQKNGDCGIQESKPQMCRDYPYDRPCVFSDCTWKAAEKKTKRLIEKYNPKE